MVNKLVSVSVMMIVLIAAQVGSSFARNVHDDKASAPVFERTKHVFVESQDAAATLAKTMESIDRKSTRSRGNSRSTKVWLGVGIAAAVVGVVVFAASRDKMRTF